MADFKGRFVWYELMTTDAKAAEEFYRHVVGWSAADAGMPDMSYTMFKAGDAMVAGAMALPQEAAAAGARPGWSGYVAVDDVDAAAAQVERAGGRIHHAPTDIPNVGRFAMVADPQGAVLALFKGAGEDAPPTVAPGTPGHIGWRELYAGDWEKAFAFYSGLFGWTKGDAMDMGEMGTYQMFAVGGETIGGMMTKPDEVPAPFWLYYFNVDAIDAAASRVTERGGKVLMGPQDVPGEMWIVQGLDPQGAMFALLAPKR